MTHVVILPDEKVIHQFHVVNTMATYAQETQKKHGVSNHGIDKVLPEY